MTDTCESEDDCTQIPWCKIRGACQVAVKRETAQLRQRDALDRVERYLGVANTEMNVHDLIHVISKGNAQEGLVLCDLIEVVKMVKQL